MIPYVSFIAALWLGAVLAISFMESWLKFRAAGMTRKVGMAVGRLVFTTLNRCEWVLFAFCLVIQGAKQHATSFTILLFVFLAAILIVQTFWLLPALNKRTMIVAQGGQLTKSFTHPLFVALEFFKVILLAGIGLAGA